MLTTDHTLGCSQLTTTRIYYLFLTFWLVSECYYHIMSSFGVSLRRYFGDLTRLVCEQDVHGMYSPRYFLPTWVDMVFNFS
jgi:hypothetical protein